MPPLVPPTPSLSAVVGDDSSSEQTVTGPGHRLRITLLMAGSCLPILGAVLIAPSCRRCRITSPTYRAPPRWSPWP